MRLEIQDEISMVSPKTMEEAYQCALKVEEKLLRKQSFNRGKALAKGRGKIGGKGRFVAQRGESSNSNQYKQ